MAARTVARYSLVSTSRLLHQPVSTFFLGIVVFVTLTGLYVWAQRRAQAIREQSARREQSAMALMLAGGQSDEDKVNAAEEQVKPRIVGRLLEDDPAEKAAAAARHAAAARSGAEKARELPPIEYGSIKTPGQGKRKDSLSGSHSRTPAEQAAAGLDPIEDLISQIMVHDPAPQTRPNAARNAARSIEPTAERKPGLISPGVP